MRRQLIIKIVLIASILATPVVWAVWSHQNQRRLHRLAEACDATGMKRALDGGADPNSAVCLRFPCLIDRVTPLMVASGRGCEACVRLLIDAGADLDACDSLGRCALVYAAPRPAIVDLLVRSGACVAGCDDVLPQTRVWRVAEYGCTESLRILMDHGGDRAGGWSPLSAAVERDLPDMVEMLLQYDGDLIVEHRIAALMEAVQRDHPACVVAFLDAGFELPPDVQQKLIEWADAKGHAAVGERLRLPPSSPVRQHRREVLIRGHEHLAALRTLRRVHGREHGHLSGASSCRSSQSFRTVTSRGSFASQIAFAC
ncbi:MAG: ankyrin repeat domain-containing protein [Phycisphaerales bacterium]|nr:ankyrin repeat domain-containing protein [Phycisphaerales bacterium]